MTKKTLTLATLMLMTSGGTWAGTIQLGVGNRAIYQNNTSKLTAGVDDNRLKSQTLFSGADEGYASGNKSKDSRGVAPLQKPKRKAPSPPALQAARETDALEEADKKKEAALKEASRKKADADIKAAQEKAALEEADKKKEAALKEASRKKADADSKAAAKKEASLKKMAEQKVKKALDHFIQGAGFLEKIIKGHGFLDKITKKIGIRKDSQTQILVSDIYKVFTDYLMKNQEITQKGMTELLFPKIKNLNANDKEAWEKIIETDARAITFKWGYEGNKNFTPKNAAIYAVRLSILNAVLLTNSGEFYNPYMEHFKKILFFKLTGDGYEREGHKNFRKHLINELKKQIQKNDTLWQYFLDIHPELKPETPKERQNLETFNDIMCKAGTKIFVAFSPNQQNPSKRQQWAEALLQSEIYKPTMIQRIFHRLTPLENILIQSMVELAKKESWESLNQRIVWLGALEGDKPKNILGQVYQKINKKAFLKISGKSIEVLENIPDAKKGIKKKA